MDKWKTVSDANVRHVWKCKCECGGEDAVVDPVKQPVAGGIISAGQRHLECEGIGRAMALEHQAAQAQQRQIGRAHV